MADDTRDRVAATLAGAKRIEGFRRRHHHSHTSNPRRDYCTADNQDWPCDVSRLLGAVEAALKLADEWGQGAAYAEARAERALDNGKLSGPATSALLSGRAQAKRDCADELREAITAALTGEADGEHATRPASSSQRPAGVVRIIPEEG